MVLSPKNAAELASEVYLIQNANKVSRFLSHPVFSRTKKGKGNHQHMKAAVGGRVVLNFKDGFGVCAEGGGAHEGELFLIFRGTTSENYGADILTDARIGIKSNSAGLPVHCGFDHCFSSMIPQIRDFFSENSTGSKTVHCIGHSLGGAVASLAADWVARNTCHTPKLYTFGAPRVGTERFAKSTTAKVLAENIHRVYHRTDPVPMIPLYPFMHAPYAQDGHYLYSADPLTSGGAHKMLGYIHSVGSKTWRQMNDVPDHPYTLESAIEGWLESKSPVNTNSPTFWRWVNSALIYVLKKVSMAAVIAIQGVISGTLTIADKIAYILAKGIDLAENISIWVEHLMRKLMTALGMRVAKTKKELTRSLIRRVLIMITERANQAARSALKKL